MRRNIELQSGICFLISGSAMLPFVGCAATARRDLAHDPFPEAQAELKVVVEKILKDSETANVEGLRDAHLDTHKFTKFGGGSTYERMNYAATIASETAAITSVQAYREDARDLKIDVFGEVAVVTYYPHRVVTTDDVEFRYSTRQTLVFLKTPDGWKIVHEHQSPKKYDLAHYPFPEAQREIRRVIQSMDDASTSGDVETLAAHHLKTDKFTRFGANQYERVGYDECNALETAFFSAVKDLEWDMQGLKIDVFEDVAVVIVTPEFSFTLNG